MSRHKRKRLLVDPAVQGALVLRVTRYWIASLLALITMQVAFEMALAAAYPFENGPAVMDVLTGMWVFMLRGLIVTVFLLPALIWDLLRFSHRFAGPISRLKHAMNDLADGKPVEPIHFRKDDFWYEFAEAFNRISDKVQPAAEERIPDAEEPEPTLSA